MNFDELYETMKKFKLMITTIVMAITFIIAGYNILKQLEVTQITLLKEAKRHFENNPCKTSIDEWGDYVMVHTQYLELLRKHNPLLAKMNIRAIPRLTKDSCKCYNGNKGGCNE